MQSDSTNERLKKFIIKQIAGNFCYSKEERKFRLSLRDIRESDRVLLRDEIKKYPEWKRQTDVNIENFINETIRLASICYNIRTVNYPTLNIRNVERGHVVVLSAEDDRCGKSELRMMSLGESGNGVIRWFVLESTRLAIHFEDVLETYDTDLWSVGHSVAFKVFRNNKRIPEGEDKVFQTYPLTSITYESPSIIHEIMDARQDYSYDEYVKSQKSNKSFKLSATRAAMSLLLHEYSEHMPFYLDFDTDGTSSTITVGDDSNLSKYDRELVCDQKYIEGPISHEKKGKVNILSDTQELVVVQKIGQE